MPPEASPWWGGPVNVPLPRTPASGRGNIQSLSWTDLFCGSWPLGAYHFQSLPWFYKSPVIQPGKLLRWPPSNPPWIWVSLPVPQSEQIIKNIKGSRDGTAIVKQNIQSMVLELDRQGLGLGYLPSHLASPSLSFPVCKWQIIIPSRLGAII